jgi:hypothetical protein
MPRKRVREQLRELKERDKKWLKQNKKLMSKFEIKRAKTLSKLSRGEYKNVLKMVGEYRWRKKEPLYKVKVPVDLQYSAALHGVEPGTYEMDRKFGRVTRMYGPDIQAYKEYYGRAPRFKWIRGSHLYRIHKWVNQQRELEAKRESGQEPGVPSATEARGGEVGGEPGEPNPREQAVQRLMRQNQERVESANRVKSALKSIRNLNPEQITRERLARELSDAFEGMPTEMREDERMQELFWKVKGLAKGVDHEKEINESMGLLLEAVKKNRSGDIVRGYDKLKPYAGALREKLSGEQLVMFNQLMNSLEKSVTEQGNLKRSAREKGLQLEAVRNLTGNQKELEKAVKGIDQTVFEHTLRNAIISTNEIASSPLPSESLREFTERIPAQAPETPAASPERKRKTTPRKRKKEPVEEEFYEAPLRETREEPYELAEKVIEEAGPEGKKSLFKSLTNNRKAYSEIKDEFLARGGDFLEETPETVEFLEGLQQKYPEANVAKQYNKIRRRNRITGAFRDTGTTVVEGGKKVLGAGRERVKARTDQVRVREALKEEIIAEGGVTPQVEALRKELAKEYEGIDVDRQFDKAVKHVELMQKVKKISPKKVGA